MNIRISEEAKKFLANKENHTAFLIDINQIDEGCTRIYNPNIEHLTKNTKLESMEGKEEINKDKYKFFISKRFLEIFGDLNKLDIDVGGLFEKMLIFSNIDAKTKNICKV
jgi:hypothetical protein